MTELQSAGRDSAKSVAELKEMLKDFSRFRNYMPEDKIENFVSGPDYCTFRIKGMTDLGLKLGEQADNSIVRMVSHGKVPFPFTMDFHLQDRDQGGSRAWIVLRADINPFLKMMAEKPLENLINMMTERLVSL